MSGCKIFPHRTWQQKTVKILFFFKKNKNKTGTLKRGGKRQFPSLHKSPYNSPFVEVNIDDASCDYKKKKKQ